MCRGMIAGTLVSWFLRSRTFVFTKYVGHHSTGLRCQWGCVLLGLCLEVALNDLGCQVGISSELFEAIEARELSVKVLDLY